MSKPPIEDNSPLAVGGEWLGFLKSIPGAGKAITRLVGGLGDAGAKIEHGIGEAGAAGMDIATAKAEDTAARIRGETKAREKVRTALANAAMRQIEANPEMGERALAHWAGDLVTKQANREAVAVRAIEHLRDEPPSEHQEAPDEDWLNIFSDFAERASSEFMREHWSRLLAGEIRKPGSFSYSTLQLMSLVDPKLASLISEMCGWVIGGTHILMVSQLQRGLKYDLLLQLQSVGFLSLGHSVFPDADGDGKIVLYCGSKKVEGKFTPGQSYSFRAAILTVAGRELYKIINSSMNEELMVSVGTLFMSHGASGYEVTDD